MTDQSDLQKAARAVVLAYLAGTLTRAAMQPLVDALDALERKAAFDEEDN